MTPCSSNVPVLGVSSPYVVGASAMIVVLLLSLLLPEALEPHRWQFCIKSDRFLALMKSGCAI